MDIFVTVAAVPTRYITPTKIVQADEDEDVTQVTEMTYDGHGRLATKHIPQQDDNAATTYIYNADDSVYRATDARGVITQYAYNNRGLVTDIGHVLPEESDIPETAAITFEYDALGNRTLMEDGLGSIEYEYDSLSRITAETRDFTDDLGTTPAVFRLEYTYALNGQLESLKDPYGDQIDYSHDKAGRVSTVTGSSFGGVTSYASTPHYRAWGGLQSLSYGNNTAMSVTFNNRLQADHYQLFRPGTSTIMTSNYDYYADGSPRKVDDLMDDKFDRMNTYDNVGRIATAKTSIEAYGQTATGTQLDALPYRQSYTFNAFGNLKERENLHWGANEDFGPYTFENNRNDHGAWAYDADGRQTAGWSGNNYVRSTYDAAGQLVVHNSAVGMSESEVLRFYNGTGSEEKRREREYVETKPDEWEWQESNPTYYIRSTVLGGEVVSDIDYAGRKLRTYVRAAGAEIAWQNWSGTNANVSFQAWDAAGMSYRTTERDGDLFTQAGYEGAPAEMDPAGGNVGKVTHRVQYDPGNYCVGCGVESPYMSMFINGFNVGVTHNGMPISINMFRSMIEGRQFDIMMMQANNSRFNVGLPKEPFERPNLFLFDTSGVVNWSVFGDTLEVRFRDNKDARSALEETLRKGECAKKLNELLANLKLSTPPEHRGFDNPVRSSDALELFDDLAGQKEGGFFFGSTVSEANARYLDQNPNATLSAGGGGAVFATHIGPRIRDGAYMNVYVFARSASTFDFNRNKPASRALIEQNIGLARRALVSTLIHEMFHAAGKNLTFSHVEMDSAAKAVDPAIAALKVASNNSGGTSPFFNAFVLKHCGVGFEGE